MTHLSQVAMSVTDLPRTQHWYRRVFGFLPAGGTNAFRGYIAEKVQGVPGAASTCWWLNDGQDHFQLELFEFYRPQARPLPDDWRLCDIGYGMVGLWVADFDGVITRLQATGSACLTDPAGEPGARRVCVRDPEGVLLELMEQDPLADAPVNAGVPVVVRSITLSVADLEQSRRVFADVLEMPEHRGEPLHTPAHGALWRLPDAERDELLLRADGVLVELVQYRDPVGRPLPDDYRISDQGLLNIALGYRSHAELKRVHRRCLDAGMTANWRPLNLGAWSVVYVNDAQGFSVELLQVKPWYDGFMGFLPRPTPRYRQKGAMQPWRKAVVTGGGSGIGLELCRRLLQEGASVAVIDRQNNPRAQEELDALAARAGAQVRFYEADVTDEQKLRPQVDTLVRELGAPDLALNCAGIQDARPFEELSGADFEKVVAVNLCGSRNFAAAVLPHMASGAQLVLMASLAGLVSNHSYAAYNASKFGVVGLAGALRLEYLPAGIEVSVICPPEVETPMVEQERRNLPAVAAQLKDTAGTLDVATACDQILAQLRRRRVTVIPGWRARGVALLARLLPGVMRRVSERIVLANSSETGRS